MMRQIATTAAGVAGGHLAANAIMGMVSGGKDEEPAPAPQAQGSTFNLLHSANTVYYDCSGNNSRKEKC